jgi:hypothetical protein
MIVLPNVVKWIVFEDGPAFHHVSPTEGCFFSFKAGNQAKHSSQKENRTSHSKATLALH